MIVLKNLWIISISFWTPTCKLIRFSSFIAYFFLSLYLISTSVYFLHTDYSPGYYYSKNIWCFESKCNWNKKKNNNTIFWFVIELFAFFFVRLFSLKYDIYVRTNAHIYSIDIETYYSSVTLAILSSKKISILNRNYTKYLLTEIHLNILNMSILIIKIIGIVFRFFCW
jgi:hypothetical protein